MEKIDWPTLPFPAIVACAVVVVMATVVVMTTRYFDATQGLLSISVIVVVAFVVATFVSMIYPNIPQTPSTEILLGGLASALGAVIAYWVGRPHKPNE